MHYQTPYKQQGAILFISLIILLMMTAIAVSSVRYSTMDQRVSLTFQQKNSTFQAAESALKKNSDAMETVFAIEQAKSGGFTETFTFTDTQGTQVNATATTTRIGLMPGSSAQIGELKLYRFKTESTASITNNNTVTELEAGFIKAVID